MKRYVFYIHGFDPRGPAPYRRMFAEEAARQAKVEKARIEVGPRRRTKSGVEWDIAARFGRKSASTRYTFLRWDDVARDIWTRGELALWNELWMWVGAFRKQVTLELARESGKSGYMALAIQPIAAVTFLALFVLASVGAGVLAVAAAGLPLWAGAAVFAFVWLGAIPAWRWIDRRTNLSWMSRGTAFVVHLARDEAPEIRTRAEAFADEIAAALDEDVDEVMVVAHSHGSPVSIITMARLLELRPEIGTSGPTVSYLTIGQTIGTTSLLTPEDGRYRRELETVRDAGQIFWLDVTSPSDGASSGRLHPLRALGKPAGRPVRRSPMFHVVVNPAYFRHIRLRPFDYHFQYLKMTEAPRAYSYFRLTCGPDELSKFAKRWTEFVEEH